MDKVMTIQDILLGYEKKDFSPVEITKSYLDRADRLNKKVNAFITISHDHALRQARIAEEEWLKGGNPAPLQGVPISYKDLINTKGIKTTNGSLIDQDNIPGSDAFVVTKLNSARPINIGKANLHEYAFGITSTNPFYGAVKNPWNLDYIPGGSSGGSGAAIATNLGLASMGTDTGGSIRIPSSACGVVGLKPTINKISTKGVKGISWSLDHVGPITQNVTDLAIMMEALTDQDYQKYCLPDIRGFRIGVPKNFFNENVEPQVYELYKKALLELEKLGAILIEIDLPFAEEASNLVFPLAIAEGAHIHKEHLQSQVEQFGDDVRKQLLSSKNITALDYINALKGQEQAINLVDQLFIDVDMIATPTLPVSPKPIGRQVVKTNNLEEDMFTCMTRFTRLFSLTGHPSLSLPMGITDEGLPAGLQLASKYHNEALLIRTGFTFEQSYLTDFYKQRESIASNL